MDTAPDLITPEEQAKKKNTLPNLVWQGSGAAIWAFIFCVYSTPEGVTLGFLIWIPLWFWRENVRSKRYGFLPGFLARIFVFTTIVAAAEIIPDKYEDKVTIGPLSATQVSLEEITEKLRSHRVEMKPVGAQSKIAVQLPSKTPTLRQVITAVEQATPFKFIRYDCGTGVTLIEEGHPIVMRFE